MRFITKVSIVAVLVSLITFPGYAMVLTQNDRVRAAFDLLLKANAVKDIAIGEDGVRPEEYDAFETLWKAGKVSENYALKLVLDGTPAAQVYGAILLLKIDKTVARREFQMLKEKKTWVKNQSGCMVGYQRVGDLVRRLEKGERIIITPTIRGVRRN